MSWKRFFDMALLPLAAIAIASVYAFSKAHGGLPTDAPVAASITGFLISFAAFVFSMGSDVKFSTMYTPVGVIATAGILIFVAAVGLAAPRIISAAVPAIAITGLFFNDSIEARREADGNREPWFFRSMLMPAALLLAFYLDHAGMRAIAIAAFLLLLFVQFLWTAWGWFWDCVARAVGNASG